MNFKRHAVNLFLAFATLSSTALAASQSDTADKIAALAVLQKYAESVSCGHSFEDVGSFNELLGNVYTMERDHEMGSATFLIRWFGDMGCQGGSGTTETMVSEVSRLSDSRPLLVTNRNAFGGIFAKKINSSFIEKMTKLKDNSFLIVSYEYDKGDENDRPSKKFLYKVEFVTDKWAVTNTKFLGKAKY